jgi:hypothetical protein
MAEARTYTGQCHCGKVRYEVELALEQVISCNCSICSKTGALLAFAPVDKFTLLSGESDLEDYFFNKKVVAHKFCKTCGVRSFARGKSPKGGEMAAINVRCLDGVDVDSIPVKKVDGKSF